MYHKPKLHEIILNCKNIKTAKNTIQKELKKDRKKRLLAIDEATGNTILHTAVIAATKTKNTALLKYLLTETIANGLAKQLIQHKNAEGQSVIALAAASPEINKLFAEFSPAGAAVKAPTSAQALSKFSAEGVSLFSLMPSPKRQKIVSEAVYAAVQIGNLTILKGVFASNQDMPRDFKYIDGLFALWHALAGHHSEIIQYFVESATLELLNQPVPPAGNQPIFFAIDAADLALVRLLIERGIKINCKAAKGIYPLHYAAIKGDAAIFKQLMWVGAELNAIADGEEFASATPLHLLIDYNHIKLVRYLLEEYQQDLKLNLEKKGGVTALDAAACLGQDEMCQMLIKVGAKINNKRFLTVLCILVYEKKYATLDLLLNNLGSIVDKDTVTPYLLTWLHELLFSQQQDIDSKTNLTKLKQFLAKYPNSQLKKWLNFLLYQIASEGNLNEFKQLSAMGVSIKTTFLLEAAIHSGNFQLVKYIVENNPDSVANQKIDLSVFPEEISAKVVNLEDDALPLAVAVANNNVTAVAYLIHQGADIHYKLPPEGETLLHCAIGNGYFEVAKMLISAGVKIDEQRASDGCAAIHFAIDLAIDCAADREEFLPDEQENFARTGDEKSKGSEDDRAARQSSFEFLHYLIETAKADINLPLVDGRNSLLIALDRADESVALWLIQHHADVNQEDCAGRTPLFIAIEADFAEATLALIAKGGKFQLKDSNEMSEINYLEQLAAVARKENKLKVVAALEKLIKQKKLGEKAEKKSEKTAEYLKRREQKRQPSKQSGPIAVKNNPAIALASHGQFKAKKAQIVQSPTSPSTLTWGNGAISKVALQQYAKATGLPCEVRGKGGERYNCFIDADLAEEAKRNPAFARMLAYIQIASGNLGKNGFKDSGVDGEINYSLDERPQQRGGLKIALKWPGIARCYCLVLSPDPNSSAEESQSLIVLAVLSKHGLGHGRAFTPPTKTHHFKTPDRWLQSQAEQAPTIAPAARPGQIG